jgi:peptidoglycan/xylan/chitin deacetylase (PgdA/CDA1 family)
MAPPPSVLSQLGARIEAGVGFRASPRLRSMTISPIVLCYHAVSDSWPDELAVPPKRLARHLQVLLLRRFRPAPLADAVRFRRKLLHVTFDDAYKSVVNAIPILEQLAVPATIFACTGYAQDGRPLGVPELVERAAMYPDELATMNWNELRAVAERGIEIGSHTLTHPHLPKLSDAEVARELRESRSQLEDELGRPCRYLAYPYGDTDDRIAAAAQRAGYDAAFALSPRAPGPYALPRVDVYRKDTLMHVTLKTSPIRTVVHRLGLNRSRSQRRSPT